jgi:tetrahydromethanopterin S-methyltransferase subunit G
VPIAGGRFDFSDARDAMLERRVEPVRRELLDRIEARVAARIGRVCAHLSPGEFRALVNRIAEIEIKYSTRRTEDLFHVAHQSTSSASTESDAALPQEREHPPQRQ